MAPNRLCCQRYGPGDTITCYISLPSQAEGAEGEVGEQQGACPPLRTLCSAHVSPFAYNPGTIHPAGLLANVQPLKSGEEPPPRCKGSSISFAKNGKCLGEAFVELAEGNYFPTISLYMGATATFNFGPDFEHAHPVELEGKLAHPALLSSCCDKTYTALCVCCGRLLADVKPGSSPSVSSSRTHQRRLRARAGRRGSD